MVIIKRESKVKVIYLSRKDLCNQLIDILKKHIGRKNHIKRRQLFIALFGEPENYSELEVFFLWEQVRRAMNWLRRTTKCFVISMPVKHSRFSTEAITYGYFVVKDNEDAIIYINQLKRSIRKMWYMIDKCKKAVTNRDYEEL